MSNPSKRSGKALQAYIDRIKPELGATNARRLDEFMRIDAGDDHGFTMDLVFSALFPEQPQKKAQENFKKFRQSINEAAETVACSLRLRTDKGRSGDLSKRLCWFEVDPADNPELEQFARSSSSQGIDPLGEQRSKAIFRGLANYTIFVSYSHKDKKQAKLLIDDVDKRLGLMSKNKPYTVKIWSDKHIDPGEHWQREIAEALEATTIGLLFLSVDFLCSEFIDEVELPVLLDTNKEKFAVPVSLMNFPLQDYKHVLDGISERQVFRYQHNTNDKYYAWNQCTRKEWKGNFAQDLAKTLIDRLDKIHTQASGRSTRSTPTRTTDSSGDETLEYALSAACFDPATNKNYLQRSHAKTGSLHDTNKLDRSKSSVASDTAAQGAVEAVEHLMQWVKEEATVKTEFMAVLGEFGIGKTTTLHQFADELLRQRKTNGNLPIPLLFDLRAYTPGEHITLEEVLTACITGVNSSDGHTWNLTADSLIHAVRHESAVAIFDGLDEVMNALTTKQRQTFIRELWKILPPLNKVPANSQAPHPVGRGRIIMSCRSHFFRDVFEQNGLYTGQQREGLLEDDRRVLLILPFTELQIQAYLKSCLGDEHGERTFALLEEIHNLIDLARRPVLANMIREIVPDLEHMRASGEMILGVDIYNRFVRKHMERDEGKHVFSRAHKLLMMEALSADLWKSGSREWPWDRMEQWLDEFLDSHPAIAKRYSQSAEVLNQDFRNATAVVRRADEKSDFRFAHTSLQEYFLACWMVRALEHSEQNVFDELPVPSDETLAFFGQLLFKSKDSTLLQRLNQWVEQSNNHAALLGLRYLLVATQYDYPLPTPEQWPLQNISLYRWQISNLRLLNADFSGSHLSETQWQNVSIQGGSLAQAKITQSNWKESQIINVDTHEIVSNGASFRQCTFKNVEPIDAWFTNCEGIMDTRIAIPAPSVERLQNGHTATVTSVSVDNERARYLSASVDNTVKVWDAQTHQCVATLEGHDRPVTSVSVDNERARYLSASSDNTVKVWDAQTHQCVATLAGHDSWVDSVSVDNERARYLSASWDNTLKVWDAQTHQCVATLAGHDHWVSSVSVDNERARYLSASYDNTVKVWDAQTHQCVATLAGHNSPVLSVSVDNERARYLSASYDNTVKVWDAQTHQCVATLAGHYIPVLSVSVDNERARYLSASVDNTVKVWDAQTHQYVATLAGHDNWVRSVSVDNERACYLSASDDNTVKVWEAQTHQCVATLAGHDRPVNSVSVDNERARYLSASVDNTVKVWEAQTHQCVATLAGHDRPVNSVSVDNERARYLSASDDNTVKVWGAQTHQCVATLEGHDNWVRSVSVDNERARYLSASDDNTVKVWDAQTHQCVATLAGHDRPVNSVSVDNERARYLSASVDNTVKVWDAQTHQCVATLKEHGSRVMSVSVDNERARYLSASSDNTVKVWDAQTYQCVATLEGHDNWVRSVSVDNERARYLSASSDNTVKVWDARTHQCVATLKGHSGWVFSVNVDKNRTRYLSASADNTVKVWDANTFRCQATYLMLEDHQWAVVDASGHQLIARSENSAEFLKWVGREAETGNWIAVPFEGLNGAHH